MITKSNDQIYLAAGGVLLLSTCAWAFFQQSTISSFREAVTAPVLGTVYEAQPLTITPPESKNWTSPRSQSAGSDWLFDVFTPPKIYYNVETKRFTVTVPVYTPEISDTPEVVAPQPSFGIELVKAEQPLFRLQLVGYVGEGANARGSFLNTATGEVIFGSSGKKLPKLNLEIVRFSAERVRTKVEGGTEIIETVATATVRDTVTGDEVSLDVKTRRPEGPPMATFKTAEGNVLSAKAGDILTIDGATYSVDSIQVDPAQAVVTKSDPANTAPETQTLIIPPPPAPPSLGESSLEGSPAEGAAIPAPADALPGAFPGF